MTTLHEKMLSAIDAYFSAENREEEIKAEDMLLDVRNEIRKQPAHKQEPVAALESVLCDPSGKCCIEGSDADRAIVDGALAALKAAQQEPKFVRNVDGVPSITLAEHEHLMRSRPQAREWVGLTDGDWAALWEEFAWESDVTINEAHQEEMVCKHGEGHYYMDPEESWNRQKDLIQKLVSAKLKEKNT